MIKGLSKNHAKKGDLPSMIIYTYAYIQKFVHLISLLSMVDDDETLMKKHFKPNTLVGKLFNRNTVCLT